MSRTCQEESLQSDNGAHISTGFDPGRGFGMIGTSAALCTGSLQQLGVPIGGGNANAFESVRTTCVPLIVQPWKKRRCHVSCR